jgi:hypothetical protein
MTAKLRYFIAILLVGALLTGACSEDGSGRLISESRSVGGFTQVGVTGGLRIEIVAGPPFSFVAEFDDNLVDNLETEVRGSKLYISCDPDCRPSLGATIRIAMPLVTALEAKAGSRVDAGPVSGRALELKASSGSRIEVHGEIGELRIHGSSDAEFRAEHLTTDELEIDLSSGSEARVAVLQEVQGDISSGATLTLAGSATPTVDVDTNSGGSIAGD